MLDRNTDKGIPVYSFPAKNGVNKKNINKIKKKLHKSTVKTDNLKFKL